MLSSFPKDISYKEWINFHYSVGNGQGGKDLFII